MNPTNILQTAFDYFQKGLRHSQAKKAQNYLASRGLNGQVPIGYNSGKWHQKQAVEIVQKGLEIGLLKPKEKGYQS